MCNHRSFFLTFTLILYFFFNCRHQIKKSDPNLSLAFTWIEIPSLYLCSISAAAPKHINLATSHRCEGKCMHTRKFMWPLTCFLSSFSSSPPCVKFFVITRYLFYSLTTYLLLFGCWWITYIPIQTVELKNSFHSLTMTTTVSCEIISSDLQLIYAIRWKKITFFSRNSYFCVWISARDVLNFIFFIFLLKRSI